MEIDRLQRSLLFLGVDILKPRLLAWRPAKVARRATLAPAAQDWPDPFEANKVETT